MATSSQPAFPTRTKESMRRNMKCKFSETDDEIITSMVYESQKNNEKIQWGPIGKMLTNHPKGSDVSHRWRTVLNPDIQKGHWTQEDDQIIIDWVKENGAKGWSQLAHRTLPHRVGKQLRERWINVLSPALSGSQTQDSQVLKPHDLFNESSQNLALDRNTQNSQNDRYWKRPWTRDEDEIIMKMYKKCGPKWKTISNCLEGRSENNVKNRWHAIQKQQTRISMGLEPIQKRGRKPEKKNLKTEPNQTIKRNLEEVANDDTITKEITNMSLFSNFDLDPANITSNVWSTKEMNSDFGDILSPTSCSIIGQNTRVQFGSNRFDFSNSPRLLASADLFCESPQLFRIANFDNQFPSPVSHIDQLFED